MQPFGRCSARPESSITYKSCNLLEDVLQAPSPTLQPHITHAPSGDIHGLPHHHMTPEIFQISRHSALILLDCAAESGLARYTHKPVLYQASGPPESNQLRAWA